VYASLSFGIQSRAWRCAEGTSTEVDLTVPDATHARAPPSLPKIRGWIVRGFILDGGNLALPRGIEPLFQP
jgi:hypothetical protein